MPHDLSDELHRQAKIDLKRCDFGKGMPVAPPIPKKQILDTLRQEQVAFAVESHRRKRGTRRVATPKYLQEETIW